MVIPKVVIFDLGKVLLDFDYMIAARRIAAQSRWIPGETKRLFDYSPLLLRYETGLMSTEEFYREVCRLTGYRGTLEEFGACFGDIFSAIEPMVELHAALRQRCPTYIFSNTNELAVRHIRRTFPFFENFDGYIFSYEHGSMKPEPRLYEVVEDFSGRRGAEILYLDDRAENIAAGAARGWQVILQESPERSRAAIEKLGLLDGGA